MPRRFRSGLLAVLVSLCALPALAGGQQGHRRVEVAFVLDTTGSMAGLIDGAKRKIWSIANSIVDANPDADIRMALIGYRDKGDDYVTDVHDMTGDIQALYGNLMRFQADGGGDRPESVNEALDQAVHALGWSSDGQTTKIIFLVGDAPPHMDYDNAPKYPEVIRDADQRGIVVNAVQAGDAYDTRQIWTDIAQRGHGRYIPIPQDGGQLVVLHSPYDDDIIVLQRQLDETVVPYGDRVQQKAVRGKVELRAAAPAAVQVDNSSFYSKRSVAREVVTGEGDLAGDIENGRQSLDKVAEADLPDALKDKTPAERQAYLDDILAKRRTVQQKLADLVKKRDAFVAAESAKPGNRKADGFDAAVQETLKVQIK